MAKIHVLYMPTFKKVYKKLHIKEKAIVDNVFVYKFKIHHQKMLLAYEWKPKERLLLALGVDENFYRDLNLKKTFS